MYYLFDFDGTLADSMPTWAGKMIRILKEEGITPPDDLIKTITPLGDRGTAEYFRTLGVTKSVEELEVKMDMYAMEAYLNKIPLKNGVFEFLKKSREQGVFMAVLTASPHKFLDPCLKRCNAFDLFDEVWSIEDFGTMKKNMPEIYIECAKRMNCKPSDIVFFDDNIVALQTAKKAGCKTVGVFDETSKEMTEEIKKTVDKYIVSFKEI